MKSVFGSHKYEDKKYKDKVEQWAQEDRLGNKIVITGETKDVRYKGKNGVKKHLSPKLHGASELLVFVGEDTHSSKGVEYEIQHAQSEGKKIIAVRIPGTKGAPPKSIRNIDLVAFEPNAIKKALKNK